MESTYFTLASKSNFNKALRHFFAVTDVVDEVESRKNLADVLNNELDAGEIVDSANLLFGDAAGRFQRFFDPALLIQQTTPDDDGDDKSGQHADCDTGHHVETDAGDDVVVGHVQGDGTQQTARRDQGPGGHLTKAAKTERDTDQGAGRSVYQIDRDSPADGGC